MRQSSHREGIIMKIFDKRFLVVGQWYVLYTKGNSCGRAQWNGNAFYNDILEYCGNWDYAI